MKLAWKGSKHEILHIIALLLIAVSALAYAQQLQIANARVGHSDAMLIQGPALDDASRINVLFDSGNTSGRDAGNILRTVSRKRGVSRLDYLSFSHDDADHLGGVAFGGIYKTSFVLGYDDTLGASGVSSHWSVCDET